MYRSRYAVNLVLLCLILAGCATAPIARIHLPEPSLPSCLVEGPRQGADPVGRYEFAPPWLATLLASIAQGRTVQATQDALQCASDTAKALREGVGIIRTFNRP